MLRRLLLVPLCSLLVACGDAAPLGPGGAGGAGGATASTTSPWGPTTTHTASGGCGHAGTGSATAYVIEVNAGEEQVVDVGAKVTLEGSASSTRCGDVLTLQWKQSSGELVILDDPTSPTPSFMAPEYPTTLGFTLRVTNELGDEGAAGVDVVVGYPVPFAHAGPDQGALGGATITLSGSGSDPKGWPLGFTWTQVSGPTVSLSDPLADTTSFVLPVAAAEPLVFALTTNNGYADSAPDWITVRRLEGADTDGDLLEDEVEIALGTDPQDPDTDRDGLPDGWEVLGHEGVDYAALGCDPLHRDLLVELVVQEYTKDGVAYSARPSQTVLSRLTDFYATLPLPTPSPDGLPGIALHFVEGGTLDEAFSCFFPGEMCFLNDAPGNFLYRESFHRASLCVAANGGCADLGGKRLSVSFAGLNADDADDLDEPAAFDFHRLFVHEMGHNLGLHHGGASSLNHKPNYPSVMNYAYFHDDPAATLATAAVRHSRGLMPAVDECALVEQGALAGAPAEDLALLPTYGGDMGWTAAADGSVDWNRDGDVSPAPYALVLRSGVGMFPDCTLLTDHDDHAAIEAGMGPSLPSSPYGLAPLLRMKRDRERRGVR